MPKSINSPNPILHSGVHDLSHSQFLVLFWLTVWRFSIFCCKEYNQSDFSIDHLVMSMCRVVCCVVGRGCLLWPVCSLGKNLLVFPLLHFVLPRPNFLLFQVSFDFLLLHSSPLWWKGHLFLVLVLEGLVYHHAAAAKSLQLCPTLCDPIDGSPPGSPLPGILQARIPEWVAISFSNAWKWKVKVKSLNRVRLLATPWTAAYQAPPSMGFSRQEYWSGVPLPSPVYIIIELFNFSFFSITDWDIVDYCDIDWFALEMNRSFCHFWDCT